MIATAYPVELHLKALLHLSLGSETNEGVANDNIFFQIRNRTRDPGPARFSQSYYYVILPNNNSHWSSWV